MGHSDHAPSSEGSAEAAEVTVPSYLETQKPSPVQVMVRAALVALLLYLILGVIIPSFADYSDVWDALTSLEPRAIVLLAALAMTVEASKAGAYSLTTDGLGFRWVALPLLSTQEDVPGSIVTLALIGLVISVVGIVIAVAVMRSERFAYKFGGWRRTGDESSPRWSGRRPEDLRPWPRRPRRYAGPRALRRG